MVAKATLKPSQRTPPKVAPWRQWCGEVLGWLGLALFLAALIVSPFLDGSTERAVEFGMRCIAAAMGSWLAAGLFAGTMTWGTAMFLVAFGAAMVGFAELVRHTS